MDRPIPSSSVPPAAQTGHTQSTTSHSTTRKPLSCSNCRQRKIKCDRVSPCVHCQKAGIQCVFPARVRANRTKHVEVGKRDSELLQRISRLESLVSKIDAEKLRELERDEEEEKGDESFDSVGFGFGAERMPFLVPAASFVDSAEEVDRRVDRKVSASTLVDVYSGFVKKQSNRSGILGGDFWTTLSDEVGGIRQLLEHDADDDELEEEDTPPTTDGSPDAHLSTPNFLFGAGGSPSDMAQEYMPSVKERNVLFGFFLSNVHPVCKVLHAPTAKMHLAVAEDLSDVNTGTFLFPSMKAVTFACGLLAVVSMTPEECIEHVGKEKDVLLANYRRGTEIALSQADLMNSIEILTIQALILYIVAIRSIDRSRASWTFIGVAVRLAHGLGLHRDDTNNYFTHYETEMRRRIWWQILVLDLRAADDRGLDPMILDGSFNTSMPSNINDEDFGVGMDGPLAARTGLTDMTMCFISYDAANTSRKLIAPSLTPDRPPLTLEQQETLVKECAYRIENTYLAGCDLTNQRVAIVFMMGRFFILKLWAHIQYPLQKRSTTEKPRFPRGQALRTVTALLEIADLVENHPQAQNHIWLFQSWIPWHPLAIALVELCTETRGELADRAWAVIDKNYEGWSSRVSGANGGMSWRPIRRLHKKALAARRAAVAQDQQQQREQRAGFEALEQQQLDHSAQGDINIIPELPALSLDPETVGSSPFYDFASNTAADQLPLGLVPGQNAPLPWDIDFLPETAMDLTGGEAFGEDNWEDWNNFVFDIHAFDGASS